MLYLPTLSHFQEEVKELTHTLTYTGAQMLPNCSELPHHDHYHNAKGPKN